MKTINNKPAVRFLNKGSPNKPVLLAVFVCHFCSNAFAQDDGALKFFTEKDLNQLAVLKENGISVGGWLSMGGTYSTDDPSNHNDFPVTFNDRTSEFQLNQLNFYIEKALDQESHWDFGGRVDFMFGTDSRFTQATGLDNNLISENDLRFYDIAIPQFYLEVYAPIGKGITAKIGHFYTILGQEVVMAPNNFFYSHAYTMQYGEPFTHTGVLFSYALNDEFTLNAGTVAGIDNFKENLANWNFLGGLTWTNSEASSAVSWSVVSGDVDDVTSENRTISSLVVSHSFTEKLQYVFEHDFGYQQQAAINGKDAFWYGINQYVFYDLTETVSAGLRGEWFRDASGFRINTGTAGNYFALTAGINWKPKEWLAFRPEIRYDWVDSNINVFNNFSKKNQLEFAMDVVIQF